MSRVVTWAAGMPPLGGAVVTIGVFDGVHLGHQALVAATIAEAARLRTSAAVVTFDRDPDRVVDPATAAPQLLELGDKLALLEALGPDLVLVVPFDADVAAMTPGAFLTDVLMAAVRPVAALVGRDFRFGAGAAGDVSTLETFGATHGFSVVGHELVRIGGEPVTSTRVRELVAAGDVVGATALLGRAHRVRGTVAHGRGEGVRLDAPTANLEVPRYAALPADGVYAGRATTPAGSFPSAISVGSPPTFPGVSATLEAHLLDFGGDLYGTTLLVEFTQRLRDQRRFSSETELARAIAADVAMVRELASGG